MYIMPWSGISWKVPKLYFIVSFKIMSITVLYNVIYTWNPNDPCLGWKSPSVEGLTFKHRGHLGSSSRKTRLYSRLKYHWSGSLKPLTWSGGQVGCDLLDIVTAVLTWFQWQQKLRWSLPPLPLQYVACLNHIGNGWEMILRYSEFIHPDQFQTLRLTSKHCGEHFIPAN